MFQGFRELSPDPYHPSREFERYGAPPPPDSTPTQEPAPPPPVARSFNSALTGLPTTIFEVMSGLSRECQSVNLGQGFPDDELEGPASMKAAVARCAQWV